MAIAPPFTDEQLRTEALRIDAELARIQIELSTPEALKFCELLEEKRRLQGQRITVRLLLEGK